MSISNSESVTQLHTILWNLPDPFQPPLCFYVTQLILPYIWRVFFEGSASCFLNSGICLPHYLPIKHGEPKIQLLWKTQQNSLSYFALLLVLSPADSNTATPHSKESELATWMGFCQRTSLCLESQCRHLEPRSSGEPQRVFSKAHWHDYGTAPHAGEVETLDVTSHPEHANYHSSRDCVTQKRLQFITRILVALGLMLVFLNKSITTQNITSQPHS